MRRVAGALRRALSVLPLSASALRRALSVLPLSAASLRRALSVLPLSATALRRALLVLLLFSGAQADAPLPCLERLLSVKEVAVENCARHSADGSMQARKLGVAANGSVAYLLTSSGGGSGIFTAIIGVRADGNHLHKTLDIAGGDRCSGGIRNARMDGDTLVIEQNLTPHMLAQHLAELIEEDNDEAPFGREDWPYCATCCTAHRKTEVQLSGKPQPASTLKINLANLKTQAANNNAAACLLQSMDAPGRSFLSLQGKQEAKALALSIRSSCAK